MVLYVVFFLKWIIWIWTWTMNIWMNVIHVVPNIFFFYISWLRIHELTHFCMDRPLSLNISSQRCYDHQSCNICKTLLIEDLKLQFGLCPGNLSTLYWHCPPPLRRRKGTDARLSWTLHLIMTSYRYTSNW